MVQHPMLFVPASGLFFRTVTVPTSQRTRSVSFIKTERFIVHEIYMGEKRTVSEY